MSRSASRLPRSLPVIAVLAVVAAPSIAQGLEACRLGAAQRPGAAAAAPRPPGCVRGAAVVAAPDVSIWRCVTEPTGDGSGATLFIGGAGRGWHAIPDSMPPGGERSFELLTADLDGDGRTERVLAAWTSQSMGMGVNRWTVRVFTGDWQPVAAFNDVVDWSVGNLVKAPQGRNGCDVMVTDVVDTTDDRGRDGHAFEGRFVRLQDGMAVPATDRPVLRRRYDRAFERERTAHFERSRQARRGNALQWLSHRDTRSVASSAR